MATIRDLATRRLFMRVSTILIPALSLTLISLGCGGSSKGQQGSPSFSLSGSPVSVQQGGSAQDTITVGPANGFSGSVSLSASGLPNGVTASFNPSTTSSTATLTLTAAKSAAAGKATITVTGTSGTLTASTTVSLTITAATSAGFTLTAAPNALSIAQGVSGNSTVTVNPINGFSGTVAFAASGLPTGVNASFVPTSTTTSSTVTLTAATTATIGTATVTITGTSGTLTVSTNISVTVTSSSSPAFTLSATPAALSMQQSSVRATTIAVNPVNGFTGNVSLAASGTPNGVTASFSPASTSSTSSLGFTADATAAVGTATVTVKGTSGSDTATTQIMLTILATPPSGGLLASFFALSNVDPTDDPTTDGMSYGAVGHPDRLAWPYIEQSPGVYDFSLYDQYAAIAPREGPGGNIAIMDLTLGMTPSWAVANQSTCRTLSPGVVGCQAPPDNQQDWTDFITHLAQHYNGSGSAPYVKYYEIWNEWNLSDPTNGYWIGTIPSLVTLQTAACKIIHAIAPSSKVLTPSTVGMARSSNDLAPQQLAQYFSYGGNNCGDGGPIDGVSFHGIVAGNTVSPYPLPGEGCSGTGCNGTIIEITNSYRTILGLNGLSTTPLFDTGGSFELGNITDADQRAAWLAQFYALQAGLYSSDNLQWVSWFTWGVPPVAGNIETAGKIPDAAGIAYNQIFNWLYGRTPTACSQSGTVWTCPLTGSSGYQAEILWDDSQTCSNGTCSSSSQTVPAWAVQMRDLAGKVTPVTGGGTIQVELKPVIVEN